MIKNRRSFICGIKGLNLSKAEVIFLKKYKPWGVILFSRNIKSIKQTQTLTSKIKKIFNDRNYPILIDEEGGRVSRLRNFIDNSTFPQKYFGNLYTKDVKKFKSYYYVYIKQISYLLDTLGININTVPVLDLSRKNFHKIIGNRSYSSDPKKVSKIGNYCISMFKDNKIATVMKHIPGHGLAKVDSHKKLPYVNNSLKYLYKNDFSVFKNKTCLFAMTAHIVFNKIDNKNCVTHSKKVIRIIRKKIGYKNIIISDDLSMKSLKYSMSVNTRKAFTAGCNLVLHCNGNFNEMLEVAKNSPLLNEFILKKTSKFINMIS